MKSLIYVIITLYLLNCVLSDECEDKVPKKVSDCTDYSLTENEKKEYEEVYGLSDTCCYADAKYEGQDISMCVPYKKSEVDNTELITKIMYYEGLEELKIDCEADSNWLSLSLTFCFLDYCFK